MQRRFSNFYVLLEVDLDAHSQAIKQAYYRQAKKYHPDTSSTGNADKFKQITEAYRVLSHPELRRDYDSTLADSPSPDDQQSPPEDPVDPFIRTHQFTEDEYQDFKGKVDSLYSKAFDTEKKKQYKDFKREEFYNTPEGPLTQQMRAQGRRDFNFGVFVYGTFGMMVYSALRSLFNTKNERDLSDAWNRAYDKAWVEIKDRQPC
jgi:curved DNA-binding protein CbpA